MDSLNKMFVSGLYRSSKDELAKSISLDCIKGIRANSMFTQSYTVEVPVNPYFPKGYYFECRAGHATEAKHLFLSEVIDRIENNELDDDKYPIVLNPVLWKSHKTGPAKKLDHFFHLKMESRRMMKTDLVDQMIDDCLSENYTKMDFFDKYVKVLGRFRVKDLNQLESISKFKAKE